MIYTDLLRVQPELRLVNNYNISSRLLNYTCGDIFLAYNVIRGTYELHSINSFKLNGNSINASIPQEYVNGFILNDYAANNHNKFLYEIQDRREKSTYLYEEYEDKRFKNNDMLKVIERTMGTKV